MSTSIVLLAPLIVQSRSVLLDKAVVAKSRVIALLFPVTCTLTFEPSAPNELVGSILDVKVLVSPSKLK